MKLTDEQKKRIAQRINEDVFCHNGNNLAAETASLFLKKRTTIYNSRAIPAPAQISMETFEIQFNPTLIAEEVSKIWIETVENGQNPHEAFDKIKIALQYIYRTDYLERILVGAYKLYLVLHELGHYLYSPCTEQIKTYYTSYCRTTVEGKNMVVPFELFFAIFNVVEDIFIQTEFRKEYPGKAYEAALAMGQRYSQGNIEEYGKYIKADEPLSIHNKLFYFILRGYNEYDPDVLHMWGNPAKLGWKEDTCQAFDVASTIVVQKKRLQYVAETVVPLVFRDLLEKTDEEGGEGDGDPLSSDKIYWNDKQKKQGNGSNKNKKSENSGESEENEGEKGGGSEDSKNNSNEDNDKVEDEDEEGEDKESKNGNGNKKESDGSDSEDSDNSENSKESENKNSAKGKSSPKGKGGSGPKDTESPNPNDSEKLQKLLKQIVEASNELNKQMHETQEREDASELIKRTPMNIEKQKIAARGCPQYNWNEDTYGSSIPDWGLALYEECSSCFAKLYTLDDYTIHRLDQGDVDPLTIIEWYTEKNHSIYSQDVKTTQGKKIETIFILDCSGSMMGSRFDNAATVITAMAHAMDDVGIPSAIYLFSSSQLQLKRLEDRLPPIINGRSILTTELYDHFHGGGTNPANVFSSLAYDPDYENDDVKVVFFLTDGCMDSALIEKSVQSDITELSQKGNWYFINIGIDFGKDSMGRLASFTHPGICKAYNRDEIVSKLGEDICETISQFIKV